ncbi:MAG TPA: DUF4157 domain-containing protein, partial [Thermoanaerobaculia bacterium]|nr:DUF4157 domain-containing protein [Thermoanaerobaculia bacterium]
MLGNQETARLLRTSLGLVQPKLQIGPPGDAYEREADRVADAVLGGPAAPVAVSAISGTVQRRCAKCQGECRCHEQEALVQPKEAPGGTAPVTAAFESRVNALRGRGEPLPSSARSYFEPRFGHDFSEVRIHVDSESAALNRQLRARAFTVGNHVAFAGEERSRAAPGSHLLAHELAHVVQQRQAGVARVMRQPTEEEEKRGVAPPCPGSCHVHVEHYRRAFGSGLEPLPAVPLERKAVPLSQT